MRAGGHQLSIRIDLAGGGRIGPGKVALLEAISETGSISAAGRAMSMSYRRAWQLVEDLNRSLGNPVVETAAGGAGGGGARLTEAGRTLIKRYRAVEAAASTNAQTHLIALDGIVAPKAQDENPPKRATDPQA
jgi:molybdate transport system regulatory protein